MVGHGSPMVDWDEWHFLYNARALFDFSSYNSPVYPPLYSALLAPAFFAGQQFYIAALSINALLSALLAIPVWLLARQLVPRTGALVAALAALCLPFEFVLAPRMALPRISCGCYLPWRSGVCAMEFVTIAGWAAFMIWRLACWWPRLFSPNSIFLVRYPYSFSSVALSC